MADLPDEVQRLRCWLIQLEHTNAELLRDVKLIRQHGGYPTADAIQAATLITADDAGIDMSDCSPDDPQYWPGTLPRFWYRFTLFRNALNHVTDAARQITQPQRSRLDSATEAYWIDRLSVQCGRISRWCRNVMGEPEFSGGIQQLMAAADSERPESSLEQWQRFRTWDDDLTRAFAINAPEFERQERASGGGTSAGQKQAGTSDGQAQQPKIIVPTNEDVSRVVNLVAGGMPVQTAAKKVAENSTHSAGSLKTMYYAYRKKLPN